MKSSSKIITHHIVFIISFTTHQIIIFVPYNVKTKLYENVCMVMVDTVAD